LKKFIVSLSERACPEPAEGESERDLKKGRKRKRGKSQT
jgi:hypothetical protein